jgi:predicted ABC-type sugar transport system permease subunit
MLLAIPLRRIPRLTGVQGGEIQADRLCHLGSTVWNGRRDEIAGIPARFIDGCQLAHLQRGGSDDSSGGVGTVLGPLVGAFTVVTLQSELSSVGSWITVIIGSIFVICVLVFRRGFIGELARLLKRSL